MKNKTKETRDLLKCLRLFNIKVHKLINYSADALTSKIKFTFIVPNRDIQPLHFTPSSTSIRSSGLPPKAPGDQLQIYASTGVKGSSRGFDIAYVLLIVAETNMA